MKKCTVGFMAGALALSACMSTSSGGGFVSRSGVRVTPVNADVFEVGVRPNAIEAEFWCGAGDYASRQLGAPNSARVYVVSGTGAGTVTSNPETAQFSLKPPQAVQGAAGRSGRWGPRLGSSKSVGAARQDCNIDRNNFWA
ncbi:hypothetical protein [Shimia sp.]|jgi:hypothetical protein|uniref:hypothetical protein n=1 Tax=unclassified Shimia TaxID=2630038 RepID=UPI0025DB1F29|nr:hypothetical protein [Shimia sp.]MCH2066380.1 hypothetical protein [Shimia sp.]